MQKLSKTEAKSREEVIEAVREAHKAVEQIWVEYQAMIEKVNAVLETFNEKVGEADTFRQSIVDQMWGYFDDRSDNWREGEKGSAYTEWMDQWQTPVETVELIDAEEMPDITGLEELEQAASEFEF